MGNFMVQKSEKVHTGCKLQPKPAFHMILILALNTNSDWTSPYLESYLKHTVQSYGSSLYIQSVLYMICILIY